MIKKICSSLTLALFIGALLSTIPQAQAQNAEKTAPEQTTTEKSKTDNTLSYNSAGFPQIQGAVELRPAPGTRITLKLTDTSRAIYEAIGKQARISVIFDPEYLPHSISVDLEGVSLHDALKIVAFESRTFWRPVTSNAIFVAADTLSKRRDFEPQIVKTFYLPSISTGTDLQDLVTSLRSILEIQRIQLNPANSSIVVRATPEQMALAERIMDELAKAKKATAGGYRLEIKVNEFNDEKKMNSRTYTLLVEPHEIGKLRTISRVHGIDVGKNIDCQIRSQTERTVELRLTVEVLDIAPSAPGAAEPSPGDAIPQQFRMESSVTLELGKPTIVSSFGDPSNKRTFQIEATAVRAKEQ
ncbi:MAG TPA: hypothetical protein VJ723_10785 [Candidatus Angelobacter sp.]|nr:hypothetical protein [Candidatus Angelobacter sp.]